MFDVENSSNVSLGVRIQRRFGRKKKQYMDKAGGIEAGGGEPCCPFSGISKPSESSGALLNESQAADSLGQKRKQASTPVSQDDAGGGGMSSAMMSEVFPFFLKFNQIMVITHAGGQVENFMPSLRIGESKISDVFALDFPRKVSVECIPVHKSLCPSGN
jgi:hypothetical protein